VGVEDSFLRPSEGKGTFKQLAGMLKTPVRELVAGENAPPPEQTADVLTLLLAYCISIERILAQAAGRSGHLPGHAVSVRGYVEQCLSGEAPDKAAARLTGYFKDAVTHFLTTHSGQQEAIDRFAQDLADAIRPGRIEERVQTNGVMKMFGLHEGAYWREFRKQFRSLDSAGLKQLVERRRQGEGEDQ